ncbi:MAG: exodeoxyribonuclease VII large subunit [Azovibrio sp.]
MLDKFENNSRQPILSVRELNQAVRSLLESNLPLTWVSGEISNLPRAASGHLYFTLKDADAQVRCTIWRNKAQLLGFRPENGQKVEARALVTLYEAKGDYQLNVETLRQAGQGTLFERFLKLKAQLEAEGLFSNELKRPLPPFPRRIAIVTSPQAAALRDVLTTLARRAPYLTLTLFPTPVQGEGAGLQIVAALEAAQKSDNELIILCRGGGSLEDLWAFNEESVARAIRASSIPVICGIGHETDFTIADFAADLRAPTPTAAAELACPDRQKLMNALEGIRRRFNTHISHRMRHWEQNLDGLAARILSPARQLKTRKNRLQELERQLQWLGRNTLEHHRRHLSHLSYCINRNRPDLEQHRSDISTMPARLRQSWHLQFQGKTNRLQQAAQSLRQLDPHAVLARGYAMVFNDDGKAIRDSAKLNPESHVHLTFARGRAEAIITKVASPEKAP